MAQERDPFTYTPQYVYEHHVFVGSGLPKPVIPPCIDDHKAIKATTTSSSIVVITYDDGCQQTRILGTLSWRNNNPGNITLHSTDSRAHGAIGFNKSGRDIFAIYPDEQTGFNAIVSQLKESDYQRYTLGNMIKVKYAPPNENDSAAYAAFVSQKTSIPENQPMTSLSEEQLQNIASAIKEYEGWRPGKVIWKKEGSASCVQK